MIPHFGLSSYVPIITYIGVISLICLTIVYRPVYGFYGLIPLIPMTNIFNRIHQYPFGNQLYDVLIFTLFIAGYVHKDERATLYKTPINKILLMWFMYTYLSLWIGSIISNYEVPINLNVERFADWKNLMLLPVIYFVTARYIKEEKDITVFVLIIAFSMLLMFKAFHSTFSSVGFYNYQHRARIGGTMGNLGPNEFGAFFAQYITIIISLLFTKISTWKRILFGITAWASMYCMLFSYSRGAYLGFICGTFIVLINKGRRHVLIFILLLMLSPKILPHSVWQRIEMTYSEEEGLDNSSLGREYLWSYAFNQFLKNPIVGVGYGTIRIETNDSGLFHSVHSAYFQILAEMGIVGFILFMLIYLISFKLAFTLYRSANNEFLSALALGFAGTVIANMVINVFNEEWAYLSVMGYYWIYLALMTSGLKITKNRCMINGIKSQAIRIMN